MHRIRDEVRRDLAYELWLRWRKEALGSRGLGTLLQLLEDTVAFPQSEFLRGEVLAETLGEGDLFDGFEVLFAVLEFGIVMRRLELLTFTVLTCSSSVASSSTTIIA